MHAWLYDYAEDTRMDEEEKVEKDRRKKQWENISVQTASAAKPITI